MNERILSIEPTLKLSLPETIRAATRCLRTPLALNQAADSLPEDEFLNCTLNPWGIYKKPWGVQGFFALEIPFAHLRVNGSFALPKLGFAVIKSNGEEIKQNHHLHETTPEILVLYVKGRAYFVANGETYPLENGVTTIFVPPGVPHDIVVAGCVITFDVKPFVFGNRKNNLPEEFRIKNGQEIILKRGCVAYTDLTFGLPWVLNPSPEQLRKLQGRGITTETFSWNPEEMFKVYGNNKDDYPHPLTLARRNQPPQEGMINIAVLRADITAF